MGIEQAKGDVHGQSLAPVGLKTARAAQGPRGRVGGEAGEVRLHLQAGESFEAEEQHDRICIFKRRPSLRCREQTKGGFGETTLCCPTDSDK